jgi:hypothetical protein
MSNRCLFELTDRETATRIVERRHRRFGPLSVASASSLPVLAKPMKSSGPEFWAVRSCKPSTMGSPWK